MINEVPRFSNHPPAISPFPDLPSAVPPARRDWERPVPAVSTSDVSTLAHVLGLCMIFVMLANLPELVYTITKVNLKMLYLFGTLAYLAVLFDRGVERVLRTIPGFLFLLFVLWMAASVPFSVWKGGSIGAVQNYFLYFFPMLFVCGGLIGSWRQIRTAFFVIALSAAAILVNVLVFADFSYSRLALSSSGTIGNANDLAAHLLLLTPFLLYLAIDRSRNWVVRLAAGSCIPFALFSILNTGSRGAVASLAIVALMFLVVAKMKVRILFLVAASVLGFSIIPFLPSNVSSRLASIFGDEHEEAKASSAVRSYIFYESLSMTVRNPIFGVGPGQFAVAEADTAADLGRRGDWHTVHCSWTQVSSECGLPAAVFLLLSIFISVFRLIGIYLEAARSGIVAVSNTILCLLAANAGYFTAISFMPNGYRFQIPALVGLNIVAAVNATREIRRFRSGTKPAQVGVPGTSSA